MLCTCNLPGYYSLDDGKTQGFTGPENLCSWIWFQTFCLGVLALDLFVSDMPAVKMKSAARSFQAPWIVQMFLFVVFACKISNFLFIFLLSHVDISGNLDGKTRTRQQIIHMHCIYSVTARPPERSRALTNLSECFNSSYMTALTTRHIVK